jgi:hypothetical protein
MTRKYQQNKANELIQLTLLVFRYKEIGLCTVLFMLVLVNVWKSGECTEEVTRPAMFVVPGTVPSKITVLSYIL